MRIPAGKKRPHRQGAPGRIALDCPKEDGGGATVWHAKLLSHRPSARQTKGPGGPGRPPKGFQARGAVGRDHAGLVTLAAEGKGTVWGAHVDIHAVDEHKAMGRRTDRAHQQRVVAPAARSGYGTRGESTQTVGFQPLLL